MNALRLPIAIAVILFMTLTGLFASDPVPNETVAPVQSGALTIESNVPYSKVYIDGVYRGDTPLTLPAIEPGMHQILVMKEGHYDEIYSVTITSGTKTDIKVKLKMITGMLIVSEIPENTDFELIIGTKSYKTRWVELPEGTYDLTIREFGYADRKTTIRIIRLTNTELSGKLEAAIFDINGLHAAKKSFNPDNPSNLGKTDIFFSVTAPGSGRMVIRDPTGKKIQSVDTEPFVTWKQNLSWDGTDANGAKVKDGIYSVQMEASGTGSSDSSTQDTSIQIDRSITYPLTGNDAGIGSSGPVVSASLMPRNGLLLNVGVSRYASLFCPYISLTAGVFDFLEAGFRADTLVDSDLNNAFKLSAGIKAGIKKGNARSAVSLVYRGQTASPGDFVSLNRNGVSLAPAFEYRTGPLTTGFCTALSFGNDAGLFAAPYLTASLGLSTRFVYGNFSTDAWINDDTSAFGTAFNAFRTWTTGLSIQYIIPSTNLQLSAEGGYRNPFDDGRLFFFRGAFGVLY